MTKDDRDFSATDADAASRFRRAGARMRREFGDALFDAWFRRLDLLRAEAGEVRLSAPTAFIKLWIDTHFHDRLAACVAAEFRDAPRVSVAVRETARPNAPRPRLARVATTASGG